MQPRKFNLPADVISRLSFEAMVQGVTKAEVVREALRMYFAFKDDETERANEMALKRRDELDLAGIKAEAERMALNKL